MVLRLPDSWSNCSLEELGFEERGKPEYPEKNLSEQRREPTTNSTHRWRRRRDLNPGHIGGRPVPSPLRHPLLPKLFPSLGKVGLTTGVYVRYSFRTAGVSSFTSQKQQISESAQCETGPTFFLFYPRRLSRN